MVTVASAAGDRFAASPPDGIRLFLVYGPDAGAVTERARRLEAVAVQRGGGDRVLRLGSDELSADPGRLADEAYAASLFGGEPVISLRVLDGRHNVIGPVQPLLERPPEAAWLIVEAGELAKTSPLRTAFENAGFAAAVSTGAADADGIAALVQSVAAESNVTVAPDALDMLTHILGGDRLATRNELDKLVLYVGETGVARVEDVEAVVGETAEIRSGHIIDQSLLGGAEAVEADLLRLKAEGISASGLATQAVRHLIALQAMRINLDRGASADAAVRGAKPPIFFKRQPAVAAALRLWPYSALTRARTLLDQAVSLSRRQSALEFSAVSDALQRIASMARRLDGRSP